MHRPWLFRSALGAALVVAVATVAVLVLGREPARDGWLDCTAPQRQEAPPVRAEPEPLPLRTELVAEVASPTSFVDLGESLLVTTVDGRVIDTASDQVVLDLHDEVRSGGEQGMFDLAISPDGDWLYLSYTREPDGRSRIDAWPWPADGPLDPDERVPILELDQPHRHHNGGGIVFGPDGHLHVGFGDGGGDGPDEVGRARDPGNWYGKILRIAPTPAAGGGYEIPADNPFADSTDHAPEIVHLGLRNPWRFGFDRDGSLWIADVGQRCVEEVDVAPPGAAGWHFGWPGLEGTYEWAHDAHPDAVPPVYEYLHEGLFEDKVTCSISGGEVYRGEEIPELEGVYVFGDLCDGRIRGIRVDDGLVVEYELDVEVDSPVAVAADAEGELHVLSLGANGGIHRLRPLLDAGG